VLSITLLLAVPGCLDAKQSNKKESTMQATETSSGLKYIVLRESSDAGKRSPTRGKQVKVHYTGWLWDANAPENKGKKFDSSVDRGMPFTFVVGVGQVIAGWDEGVAGMKVGEARRLIIPGHLAYGARGVPGLIPANATLVFDVELLDA
jgi:FKBP-type peptidyl-prolyl cis-trans isomerase FkpA